MSTALMTEKDLVLAIREAKIRLELAEKEKAAAEMEYEKLKAIIVEELTEKDAKSTAKYDGIGVDPSYFKLAEMMHSRFANKVKDIKVDEKSVAESAQE